MQDESVDLVFKALAHSERRRILAALLARPGQSLFEICVGSAAGPGGMMSRQTISQHLEVLERAGLIETAWQGRTKAHSVTLGPLRAALAQVAGQFLQEG